MNQIEIKEPHFLMTDQLGRLVHIHENTANIFGKNSEELIGSTVWDTMPDFLKPQFKKCWNSVLRSPNSKSFQTKFGDSEVWIEVLMSWTDLGVVIHMKDISAWKTNELKMQSNENLLKAVFDALPMWISVKDNDFRFLMVNKQALKATGLKIDDYLNTHTLELPLVKPKEMKANFELDKQVISEGKVMISPETNHTLADGKEHTYIHHKAPFLDSEGKVAGVVTISNDITEYKRTMEALNFNQNCLSMAQEMALVGSWDFDINTGQMDWAEGLFKLLHQSSKKMKPSYENLLSAIHVDDREKVVNAIESAISSNDNFDIEHRITLDDQSIRIVHHKGKVIHNENKHKKSLLGVVQDITKFREIEDELREFTGRLKKSNRDLEEFASIASHDMQEPLRKIMAFGERLQTKHGKSLNTEANDYLHRMLDASERLQILINDLLTYSRIATKGRSFIPTDLNLVVEEVLNDLEVRVAETGTIIEVGELPTIDADSIQMRQLFQNLISNSIKYSRSGVIPKIKINASSSSPVLGAKKNSVPNSTWKILVEDNGIGFEQKYAERIFSIFKRLHGRNAYPGNGVGLAICRKIVDRHGGAISASGKPEEGAQFTIEFKSS